MTVKLEDGMLCFDLIKVGKAAGKTYTDPATGVALSHQTPKNHLIQHIRTKVLQLRSGEPQRRPRIHRAVSESSSARANKRSDFEATSVGTASASGSEFATDALPET